MKAIAQAQLNAKQLDAAKDTIQMALELISPLPDEDAEAYFPLADLCLLQAKVGDVAGALETVSAVSSSAWKVSILTEIAASHAEAGRKDQAQKTLRLALDASRGAQNDALWTRSPSPVEMDPSLPILNTLAHAQARIGDIDAALNTVAGMNQSTMGKFTRNQCVNQIATTLLAKGDIAGARRAIEAIPDSDPLMSSKAEIVERIAKRQAEQGDATGALAWAGQQQLPDTKLHALRGMADGVVERITKQDSKNSKGSSATTKPTK